MSISSWTLFRFGFRQTLKSAVIIGLVAGGMLALQGIAYQKAYPDTAARTKFAVSLASAPGLGFLYGDPQDLYDGTPGYMVYRVLGFMGAATAVWALMTTTKMLRGAEEDGRYEILRMGSSTPRQVTAMLTLGFAGAWWVALLISYVLTLLTVKAGGITTTASVMFLLNIGIFLPALLFAGVGVLTSQLGLTRGRALLYGLVPLALLYLVRGVGFTVKSLHWLLYYTPFGWVELIDPIHGPNHVWLYLPVAFGLVFACAGIWLADRDYGSSVIYASTTVRSRFMLLGNAWQLALRQNFGVLASWAVGALLVISIIAALANTAVDALKDAGSLSKAVYKLGGANNLKVAFLSSGVLFMVMVLLILSISIIGQIRRDEARQYLDNILVAPQKRTVWLVQRLMLGLAVVLVISLLAGVLLQLIANEQHVAVDFGKVLATSVCVVGSVAFLMSLGVLLYGLLPRFAVIAMYVVIVWSFVVTLLDSSLHLNTVIKHSTIFLYTNFNLTQWPDWTTFGWFLALTVVLSATGIHAFTRRDIVPE